MPVTAMRLNNVMRININEKTQPSIIAKLKPLARKLAPAIILSIQTVQRAELQRVLISILFLKVGREKIHA